jgi:hypothetical protein
MLLLGSFEAQLFHLSIDTITFAVSSIGEQESPKTFNTMLIGYVRV